MASISGGLTSQPDSVPTLTASLAQGAGVVDIIMGTGNTGPYVLTWTAVERGSERVTVNGMVALPGLDYQLDCEAGKLVFAKPLRQGDMARVDYSFRPGAKANPQPAAPPVSVPLATLAGADLAMVYAHRRGAGGPGRDLMVLGLTGERRTGDDTQVTGRILLSEPGADEGTPAADRTAVEVTANERVGSLRLSARHARVGERFGGGRDFGLKAGVRTWDVGAEYDQGRLSASTQFSNVRDLGEDGERAATWQHSFAYEASGLPMVAFTRSDQSTFDGSGRLESRQTADLFSLQRTFGPTGVLVERKVLTVAPGGESQRQLIGDRIAIEHRLGPDTMLMTSRERTLARLPGDRVERTTADSVGISAKVFSCVSADVGHEQKTLPDGEVARTDEFGLSASPTGWLKFKLAHLESDGPERDGSKSVASVALVPRQWARISAGLERDTDGDYRRSVSRLNATFQPKPFLTLAGGYVSRDDGTAAGSVDSSQARIALAVAPSLKITGERTENPEDDKGRLTVDQASKIGLVTDLGPVGLKGTYGRRVDAVGAEMRDSEVHMSVALAPSTKIYTGYRVSESLRPSVNTDQQTYRVGVSHEAGSDFSLSLEAQRILYHENEHIVSGRQETRAEARLSVLWR